MKKLIGFDIGGTKCAVIYAQTTQEGCLPEILEKKTFPTAKFTSPQEVIAHFIEIAKDMMLRFGKADSAGISCGGPLSSKKGIILSPPNLPGWDEIHITEIMEEALQISVYLQNDANACALAEWKFGNGAGTDDFVFLTFGTGLGAGLILDGRLIVGKCDTAGEVGHWRLSAFGPVGYGKAGSFEGFASGGGIAQLAQTKLLERIQNGLSHPLSGHPGGVTAKAVFALAREGDEMCLDIVNTVGTYFGKGLASIVDILNPEVIVAGSIFTRNYDLLHPIARKVIDREALPAPAKLVKLLPCKLDENIGDYASLTVALGI